MLDTGRDDVAAPLWTQPLLVDPGAIRSWLENEGHGPRADRLSRWACEVLPSRRFFRIPALLLGRDDGDELAREGLLGLSKLQEPCKCQDPASTSDQEGRMIRHVLHQQEQGTQTSHSVDHRLILLERKKRSQHRFEHAKAQKLTLQDSLVEKGVVGAVRTSPLHHSRYSSRIGSQYLVVIPPSCLSPSSRDDVSRVAFATLCDASVATAIMEFGVSAGSGGVSCAASSASSGRGDWESTALRPLLAFRSSR